MKLRAALLDFRGLAAETIRPLAPTERLPAGAPGSYALVLELAEPSTLRIGRLGERELGAGTYVYCGSALGGLSGRIERHRRREKRLHWHVDYLLESARLIEAWVTLSSTRLECSLAGHLLAYSEASVPVLGFGSSDCRCASHLLRWQEQARLTTDEAAQLTA